MAPFTFQLPQELCAREPPERRGVDRDKVRLLVIDRATDHIEHTRFDRIGDYLREGDLLVFNSSRTLPASLSGCADCLAARGEASAPCMEVRLAQHMPDDSWLALLLCKRGDPFGCGLRAGMQIDFPEDLRANVEARDETIPRLWRLRFSKSGTELVDYLYRHGSPIRYEYVSAPWDIDYYQTVYAREPGSAEMPSAGRAFTWRLLFELRRRGVKFAHLVLHTSLSSYMDDELDRQHPASTEEYLISEETATEVNEARGQGARVIAVGTTVVRALESAAQANGTVIAGRNYTKLLITKDHQLRAVDGLLTGMHEPEASHLDLLAAFVSPTRIGAAYHEAVQLRYLWHEFGDLNLIL